MEHLGVEVLGLSEKKNETPTPPNLRIFPTKLAILGVEAAQELPVHRSPRPTFGSRRWLPGVAIWQGLTMKEDIYIYIAKILFGNIAANGSQPSLLALAVKNLFWAC